MAGWIREDAVRRAAVLVVAVSGLALAGCGPVVKIEQGAIAGHREDQLFEHSSRVAVVTVQSVTERINAADNRYWGGASAVYREALVRVERVIKGEPPVSILQTGGEVNGFRHVNSGETYLEVGVTYLLFLADWMAPEKEGSTPAVSLIGGPGQVVFTQDSSGDWVNLDGSYTLTEEELAAGAAR